MTVSAYTPAAARAHAAARANLARGSVVRRWPARLEHERIRDHDEPGRGRECHAAHGSHDAVLDVARAERALRNDGRDHSTVRADLKPDRDAAEELRTRTATLLV